MSEYSTTGLFVSGSITSVVFIKIPLNSVLCNKYIHFLNVLKFSVMLYSKILENSRCRESVSYTFNITVKCPGFKFQTSFHFYS